MHRGDTEAIVARSPSPWCLLPREREPARIRAPPRAQQAAQVLGAIGNARHGRRHQLDILAPGPAYAHGTAAQRIPLAIPDLDIDDLVAVYPCPRPAWRQRPHPHLVGGTARFR